MIKRLKWNVIHDDDVDDAQQTSSDESEPEAQTLQKLMRNDPDLNALRPAADAHPPRSESPLLRRHKAAVSASGQSESESDASAHPRVQHADEQPPPRQLQDAPEQQGPFHEWKECVLCSKRFYNDDDMQAHLSSKRHMQALQKHNNTQSKLNKRPPQFDDGTDDGAVHDHNENTQHRHTEEPRRARSKRKKAAAKRKLRALKKRKWEKQTQSVSDGVANT